MASIETKKIAEISSREEHSTLRNHRLSFYLLLYGIIYLTAAFLLLFNLSDRLLWGDEAETALLGRNILEFGIPKIDDGRNVISQYPEPWEANQDGIWTWNTWLPYYVAALSFKIFGESTFAARFPFALIGLLAVILVRKAARGFFEDQETALIATALLAFSVPFLLHARQCRYFSMLALGTIWLLIGYDQLVFEGKRRGGLHMAFALVFLFYSSFVSFVGNAAGIGLYTLLLLRKRKEVLRLVFPYLCLAGALVLPWAFYAGMFHQGSRIKLSRMLPILFGYIVQINFHIFPLLLLLLPPIVLLKRRIPIRQWIPSDKTLFLFILVVGHLIILSVFPFVYFRYLVTFLPIMLLLEAHILRQFVPMRSLRYIVLLFLLATNIPGLVSLYPWRGGRTPGSPIIRYAKGITTDYDDKFEDVLAFLKANAHQTDSVALMDPGYPLVFYSRMKTIDARWRREDIWKADWILGESPSGVIDYGPNSSLTVPEALAHQYQVYTLMVRDTPLGASRPDPDLFRCMSAGRFKPFVIYRRIK
jgi:hypothetical protein